MSGINNRKSVIVGIFVFIGIAIIVAGILTLGGQKKTFVKAMHINAVFDDVNGLAVGNNVWFSGVKIGTIKNISFDQDANVQVQMSIEEKVRKYIHQDAMVKISSDGFIGNKIVVIYGGTATSPQVVENSRLVVGKALNPEEMLSTLQDNNKNLLAITSDFKTISEKMALGKGSVGKLLNDETLFNDLHSAMVGLKQATAQANDIARDLSAYTSKFGDKGTLANDLVTDTVIFSSLRNTVARINTVSAKADAVVDNLSKASSQLNNSGSPLGALLNDEAASKDLKATLKNLHAGTEKLDENMEALQHNFLLRGFFRKKARQAKNESDSIAK